MLQGGQGPETTRDLPDQSNRPAPVTFPVQTFVRYCTKWRVTARIEKTEEQAREE